ncbi:hypothetical protein EAE96_004603 [Botrytis aclada]|nr:hypothetical protein EAE96_004603 [Botrytis aclada]
MTEPFKDRIETGVNLCDRCTAIKLDEILQRSRKFFGMGNLDKVIMTLEEPKERVWLSSCTFCQLLKAVDPRYLEDQTRLVLSLHHSTSFNVSEFRLRVSENGRIGSESSLMERTSFSLYPDKYLCFVNPSGTIRVLDPGTIDFAILQSWIESCRGKHQQESSLARPSTVKVPPLQVINVETRQLESAKERVQHVALSYVWGHQQSTASSDRLPPVHDHELAHELPATIEDAITVTMRLGFKYLWVDRYCVPQGNDRFKEKHDQISWMDQIYYGAELTIIAAAGKDANSGLPGIGSTKRVQQLSATIGNYTLTTNMTTPRRIINSSIRATRAWTYQDAMFSRRRLVFTEEQAYFECQKMSCRETVNFECDIENYNVFQETPLGMFPWSILNHISEYSKREMTYSVDALNVLLGVFRVFRQQENAVHHLWGIPVIPPTCKHQNKDVKMHETLEQGFVVSLTWEPNAPGARRPGFPNWSWAGWTCSVSPNISVDFNMINWVPFKLAVSVSIGRKDGSFIGFQEAFDEYIKIDNLESLSCSIRIKGWTIDLFAKLFPPMDNKYGDSFNFYAWPASTDQVDAQLAAKITLTKAMNSEEKSLCQTKPRRLLGIIIEALRDPADSMFTLVVEEIGEGRFERVGHSDIVPREVGDTMQEISISSNDCLEIDLGEELRGGQNTHFRHELGLKELWLANRIIRDVQLI